MNAVSRASVAGSMEVWGPPFKTAKIGTTLSCGAFLTSLGAEEMFREVKIPTLSHKAQQGWGSQVETGVEGKQLHCFENREGWDKP
jgi:hypothetical protein